MFISYRLWDHGYLNDWKMVLNALRTEKKKFRYALSVIIAKTRWSVKSPWTERNVEKSQFDNLLIVDIKSLRIFTIDQDIFWLIYEIVLDIHYSTHFLYYYTKTTLIKRNVFESHPYRWRYTITDYRQTRVISCIAAISVCSFGC